MSTIAKLNAGGRTFLMMRGTWSATYPTSELSAWIRFYRRQAEMFPDRAAYVEDLSALEDLAKSLTLGS